MVLLYFCFAQIYGPLEIDFDSCIYTVYASCNSSMPGLSPHLCLWQSILCCHVTTGPAIIRTRYLSRRELKQLQKPEKKKHHPIHFYIKPTLKLLM